MAAKTAAKTGRKSEKLGSGRERFSLTTMTLDPLCASG